MKYLFIGPSLGLAANGALNPGGLYTFGRCIVRALASTPQIDALGIWLQFDDPSCEPWVRRILDPYAHSGLKSAIECFGGSPLRLARAVALACWRHDYDDIMYAQVNQAMIGLVPGHLPYTVWEIGRELFVKLPRRHFWALRRANRLLSISSHTTETATRMNPGLPLAKVVAPCVEPTLSQEGHDEYSAEFVFRPELRKPAVMIVGNLYKDINTYKGHRELIATWPAVVNVCPTAELWIVGDGGERQVFETQARSLPNHVATNIHFLGRLDDSALQARYLQCRVFAMPSTQEGFGIVFVEAAKYGVPSIGGKYDAVKEIVADGETGLLVEQTPKDIANACIALLTNDELAGRLGNAARLRFLNCYQYSQFRTRLLEAIGLDA